jgi:hypothetical protein
MAVALCHQVLAGLLLIAQRPVPGGRLLDTAEQHS